MLVGLVRSPLIVTALVPLVAPVKPPVTVGADQLYKVPAGTTPLVPSIGVILNATPLQLTVVIAVIIPTGLMVTVTVNGVAVPQLTILGVTI